MIGLGDAAVTAWDIAKWPVLVLLVSFMFSVLYWAAPNVKQPGFRWLTPGGVLAVVLWIVASAAFALYVASFASYNKTYGSLGGVIVFLIWLWISNIAVLLGAELNAEVERGRELEAGMPEEHDARSSSRGTSRRATSAGRGSPARAPVRARRAPASSSPMISSSRAGSSTTP